MRAMGEQWRGAPGAPSGSGRRGAGTRKRKHTFLEQDCISGGEVWSLAPYGTDPFWTGGRRAGGSPGPGDVISIYWGSPGPPGAPPPDWAAARSSGFEPA